MSSSGSSEVDMESDGDSIELTEDARKLRGVVPGARNMGSVAGWIREEDGGSVLSYRSLDPNDDLAGMVTLLSASSKATQHRDSNEQVEAVAEVVTVEEEEFIAPVWCLKFER